jgi:hypothetical protein
MTMTEEQAAKFLKMQEMILQKASVTETILITIVSMFILGFLIMILVFVTA